MTLKFNHLKMGNTAERIDGFPTTTSVNFFSGKRGQQNFVSITLEFPTGKFDPVEFKQFVNEAWSIEFDLTKN